MRHIKITATADTISRWENKRYPTIKEENAQKLAEALEVEVSEILLVEDQESTQDEQDQSGISSQHTRVFRMSPLLVLILVAVVLAAGTTIGLLIKKTPPAAELRAERIMPERALPNSSFPVIIKVHYQGEEPLSIILKEILPAGSIIEQTSPPAGSESKDREIKWLKKVNGTTRFSYLVKIENGVDTTFSFDGTISTSAENGSIKVSGSDTIQLGSYHWADQDGDNRISDQEILTVFDYYSGIDDFTVDIEFIEKMWLGSKYSWDEGAKQITISP